MQVKKSTLGNSSYIVTSLELEGHAEAKEATMRVIALRNFLLLEALLVFGKMIRSVSLKSKDLLRA